MKYIAIQIHVCMPVVLVYRLTIRQYYSLFEFNMIHLNLHLRCWQASLNAIPTTCEEGLSGIKRFVSAQQAGILHVPSHCIEIHIFGIGRPRNYILITGDTSR